MQIVEYRRHYTTVIEVLVKGSISTQKSIFEFKAEILAHSSLYQLADNCQNNCFYRIYLNLFFRLIFTPKVCLGKERIFKI